MPVDGNAAGVAIIELHVIEWPGLIRNQLPTKSAPVIGSLKSEEPCNHDRFQLFLTCRLKAVLVDVDSQSPVKSS